MNNKAVTLTELLIVIVIMGILSTIGAISVSRIIEDTRADADEHNVQIIEDAILRASIDGVLIIKNNQIYNTVSKRAYSGTASWFFEDMIDYIDSQVRPQASVALNRHNHTGDEIYKFWFQLNGNDVSIFYYDSNRNRIILSTFTFS